jgi:hypothetical protein
MRRLIEYYSFEVIENDIINRLTSFHNLFEQALILLVSINNPGFRKNAVICIFPVPIK